MDAGKQNAAPATSAAAAAASGSRPKTRVEFIGSGADKNVRIHVELTPGETTVVSYKKVLREHNIEVSSPEPSDDEVDPMVGESIDVAVSDNIEEDLSEDVPKYDPSSAGENSVDDPPRNELIRSPVDMAVTIKNLEDEVYYLRNKLNEANWKNLRASREVSRFTSHLSYKCEEFLAVSLKRRCINKKAKKHVKRFVEFVREVIMEGTKPIYNELAGYEAWKIPPPTPPSPTTSQSSSD